MPLVINALRVDIQCYLLMINVLMKQLKEDQHTHALEFTYKFNIYIITLINVHHHSTHADM